MRCRSRLLRRLAVHAMPSRHGNLSPFVVSVFVGHVPIGEDDDATWKSFPPSSFFRVPDFKIDVVPILQPFIKLTLKSVGPLGSVLNETIEELAVCIYAGD